MAWSLIVLGCWLSLVAGASWAADEARAPLAEPIVTTEREFAIPFVVEPFDERGEPLAWVQMLVSVEHEGLYGFWMTMEDALGVEGATPRDGDLPQVWVGVDLSSPDAQLLTAEVMRNSKGDQLTIRWEASDAFLAPNPISISY